MCRTSQMRGVSILHHGVMVWNELNNVIHSKDIKLPQWFNVEKLLQYVYMDKLRSYTIMHDCGKPYCEVVDENGKKHFPDHANVSAQVYNKYFDNYMVHNYIKHDMFLHTCSSVEAHEFQGSNELIAGLLLVSFAEIYANCKMFGGVESTSFKIKYKQLDKRGKVLFDKLA